jgi:hypothetical protein
VKIQSSSYHDHHLQHRNSSCASLNRQPFSPCGSAHTNQLLTPTQDYLIRSNPSLNEHRRLTAQTLTIRVNRSDPREGQNAGPNKGRKQTDRRRGAHSRSSYNDARPQSDGDDQPYVHPSYSRNPSRSNNAWIENDTIADDHVESTSPAANHRNKCPSAGPNTGSSRLGTDDDSARLTPSWNFVSPWTIQHATQSATEKLGEVLCQNPDLQMLYHEATERLPKELFLKHHDDILKSFFELVRSEVTSERQLKTIRVLRYRSHRQ